MKLTKAFQELEDTLVRNVANHIIQYEFHKNSTDEELVAYYGGGYTSREALMDDTIKRLISDQQVLKFVKNNHANLIETYGEKDPAGDIGISLQRATGADTEPEGVAADAGEDGPEPSTEHSVRPTDSADESDNGAEQEGGDGGSTGDRGTAA